MHTLLYQYWPSSHVVKQLASPIDPTELARKYRKVSVGATSIYALQHGNLFETPPPLRFIEISFSEGRGTIKERASFSKHRGEPSLVNYLDKYIFLIGGGVGEKTPGEVGYAKYSKTTRLYDIE